MNTDIDFFYFISGFAGKWKRLDYLGVLFAKFLPYIMFAGLVAITFFQNNIRILILSVLCGLFSRFVINEAIYLFYKRKRPPEVLNVKTLIKIPNHPSFPSGHASFFFGMSFPLLLFSFVWGATFCVLSILMGFSRVFVGVHWPSDVLAGILAGAVSSFLIYPLYLWILYNL